MTLKKTLLASAVAGLLFSANAGAVDLNDPTTVRTYASEIDDGTTLTDTADTVEFAIGYNFSPAEVRYGRFECTSNLTMDNVTVTSGSTDVDLGAINGEATSALFFSMTADPALAAATDAVQITVDADNTLEDGGNVNCAFSIYDQPSQAQAGGSTGQIYTTGFKPFITRASGVVFAGTAATATADVEDPAGAYFGFDGANTIGTLRYEAAAGVLDEDGAAIALTDIFSTDTTVSVDGDLSAAANINWAGYGNDDGFNTAEDSATFEVGNAGIAASNVSYVATGADALPETSFTATLNGDTNTGYTFVDRTVDLGSIVRNGTQLQAPLVQTPAGWLSRMVLTNTGSLDRPYEISFMGETGRTFDTANLTGTVPANGTVVVDLNSVLSNFNGNPRATLNVTVAGPNNQIQGLYQIVNPAAGSISNHVMVRPGLN